MTRESEKLQSGNILPDEVSAPVLARWLGLSGKAVYDLAKAGILVRAGGGLYKLEQSVTRYCEYLRRAASQRDSEASSGIPNSQVATSIS